MIWYNFDITNSIAITAAEYKSDFQLTKSDFQLTKDTLMGDLWAVNCEDLGKKNTVL